ncbi:glycosyltransferase family 2 protein [Clostridium cadaveris]|uniref:glycosyltransferase family A protein n=1 Tax=Clostridium cadaveris TaxID=1529 RepID=UPI0014597816|nr:glycosyltransferase family A protein [Clostridium cadaveris]NME63968.1 glycosyltransferase family 2 protein [Clostridium cadaveris]
MDIQVLVAAVNQEAIDLCNKLRIKTDVIISNQCEENSVTKMKYKENDVLYLNFKERGVGLNRNNAMMRSTADICLIADDDIEYVDNYDEIVKKQFLLYPDADIIIFNIIEKKKERYVIKKPFKVNWFNFMRFGAVRIAFRREKIFLHGISFNLCFGGGTKHSNGEDTLFLASCLKEKLNIYAVPVVIASLTEERKSSWFLGYNDKYFKDKALLYYLISHRWSYFLCFQDAIRHRKLYYNNGTWIHNIKVMLNEMKNIKY